MSADCSVGPYTDARDDPLSWIDYFIAVAALAAQRSKDPHEQCGACIVNESNKIVGIGYNGLPFGCDDDEFPWTVDEEDPLQDKSTFTVTAIINATLNKNIPDLEGCRLFTTNYPTSDCAKVMLQSGLSSCVYMQVGLSEDHKAATRLLATATFPISQYKGGATDITLSLLLPDRERPRQ